MNPYISVFDLDYTLIAGNSSYSFYRYLWQSGVLPRFALLKAWIYHLRYHCCKMTLDSLHQEVFEHLLKGLPMREIGQKVEPFLKEYLASHFYMPAFFHLRLAQHLGHYTVIMSSSPEFLVGPIARHLGVDEWVATEYQVDQENRLSAIAHFVAGEAKKIALNKLVEKQGSSLSAVTAYSDSYHDLPLLLSAGQAVAVNPDRRLIRVTKDQFWPVL